MLEDFLSKLGASTRITVGVSVSPGVGLEMIEVDRLTGTVNKYSCKPLEYNSSTREIADYELFRVALEELFEELHIPKRSNIVLSLPNVYFGMITLPLLLTDEAITNAIISEVEQSYIFKRQEPVVSWSEVSSNSNSENRILAYTALQKSVLEQITEICSEIGCSLVGIENSYSSLFRALHFLGSAKEQMKENVSWNLMVIMQNNYSIFSVSNKKVMEYYEEPLALKSFVNDEIYNAIRTSAQLTLAGLPANYLFIISETDLVSAEVLSMKMSFEGSTKFLECNKFIQKELLPINLNVLPNMSMRITLEAIGTAVYQFCDFPLRLNITQEKDENLDYLTSPEECPRINVGNLEVELTPAFIKKIAVIIGAIVTVPILFLLLLLSKVIIPSEQVKLNEINNKIQTLSKEIEQYKDINRDATFDLRSTIDKIISQNKIKLTYFSALAVSTPNKLWLTSYELNGANKVDIKGQASDVKNVYAFYKNLKQVINNSDIRLYKLEVTSESLDDIVSNIQNTNKVYQFEITNLTENELKPPETTEKRPNQPENINQPSKEKKPFFQIGKPLFGSDNSNPEPEPEHSPIYNEDQLPANLKKIERF